MSLRTISLRCRQLLVWSAAVWLFVLEAPAQNTGVYVGGHIRRERPATVQKLKHSGFSYVILFNINVETDGTLTTDGETVCRDGEYVFAETQPFYADDVRELKTWPTAIRRIEICIGGWGNESYSRIRSLVASEGTGESSILYRNFQALKMAVPEIDAVNNDDEHAYGIGGGVPQDDVATRLPYLAGALHTKGVLERAGRTAQRRLSGGVGQQGFLASYLTRWGEWGDGSGAFGCGPWGLL